MGLQIKIESNTLSNTEIMQLLEAQPEFNKSGVRLEIPQNTRQSRGTTDPALLVAIVGLSGSALGALISGLFQVIQQRVSKKIVLRSKNGAVLEIPADTRLEDIDQLIEKVKQMDVEKIILP